MGMQLHDPNIMDWSWPSLNPISVSIAPTFQSQTFPPLADMSPTARKFILDTYEVKGNDASADIFYLDPKAGLKVVHQIPRTPFRITHVPDVPPFVRIGSDVFNVTANPKHPDDLTYISTGAHTHTIQFWQPLTLELVRELRYLEALNFSSRDAEPVVFLIVVTYKAKDTPLFRSFFLGNLIKFDDLVHEPGELVTKTTIFQCFVGDTLVPVDPDVRFDPDLAYEDMRKQAAIFQHLLEEDDEKPDPQENFGFDEDEDDDD